MLRKLLVALLLVLVLVIAPLLGSVNVASADTRYPFTVHLICSSFDYEGTYPCEGFTVWLQDDVTHEIYYGNAYGGTFTAYFYYGHSIYYTSTPPPPPAYHRDCVDNCKGYTMSSLNTNVYSYWYLPYQ